MPIWATPLISALAVVLGALLSPYFVTYWGERRRQSEERQRRIKTLDLLAAEFAQIARHSATNLRRLTEIYRTPRPIGEVIIGLKKMSLERPDVDSSEALFTAAKMEDLALLPQALNRDAMRLQLVVRNIEIDIDTTIVALSKNHKEGLFNLNIGGEAPTRLRSLSKTVERCAADSRQIVSKLHAFSERERGPQIPQSWPVKILRSIGRHTMWWLFRFKSPPNPQLTLDDGTQDRSIHFDDAINLKQVADWIDWKEEQRLLPVQGIEDYVRKNASLLTMSHPMRVSFQFLGTINLIAKIEPVEDEAFPALCLRIRVNEDIFQYEKGLIKDVFVARIVNEHNAWETEYFDDQIADILQKMKPSDQHMEVIKFPIGTDIYFYSGNCDAFPHSDYPGLISQWAPGSMLGEAQCNASFQQLGANVASLHEIKFRHYYRNFRDLGEYRFSRNFASDVMSEIDKRADFSLPKKLANNIVELSKKMTEALQNSVDADGFVLCHNDIHPNNVYTAASGSDVRIIDWDNACVSHKYLDFVKVRFWGPPNASGRFQMDREYFRKFCKGYEINDASVLGSTTFLTLCLLWLLRVYTFEKQRGAGGTPIPKPFLEADVYEGWIKEVLEQLATAPS